MRTSNARADPLGLRRRLAGLAVGPLLFGVVLAWPIAGLSREAHALAAVFAWAIAYWVTEAIPAAATALLSSVLAIALGIAPARAVLAPYADLFMLPVSTPPNAIVYGSGLVPLKEMVRAGLLFDLAGAAVIWVGLRVLCPLVGLV